jgi:predicted nucleic acid-binding protein
MPDSVFFDTNVLVYFIVDDAARTPRADELLASGGIISVQILNEFVSVARGKLKMPWQEVDEAMASIRRLCPDPLPLTIDTHEGALRIAQRYGFRFFDALVAASALEAGCTTLYSEDLQDGQIVEGRLAIRNPFRIVGGV